MCLACAYIHLVSGHLIVARLSDLQHIHFLHIKSLNPRSFRAPVVPGCATSIANCLPCQRFMTSHIDLRTSKVCQGSMTRVMPESPKFLLPCGRHLHENHKPKKILSVTQENFHSCGKALPLRESGSDTWQSPMVCQLGLAPLSY